VEIMMFNSIEAERARNGMSKEELATQIGISVKTYYNWLNGVNPIPSTALIKMSDIFGVTIDYLLNRDNQRKAV
jgi:transcriptional regulator with XRE-family HTH domain